MLSGAFGSGAPAVHEGKTTITEVTNVLTTPLSSEQTPADKGVIADPRD